jgi:DHA2 family multidrug resistance protein
MLIFPQVLRGIGLALMMAPLLTAALNAVPKEKLPMASSFLNVAQRVGGAVGIALLNNFVTNSTHVHAVRMGEAIPAQSPVYARLVLHASRVTFHQTPGVLAGARLKATFAATEHIAHNAQVLGFNNGFVLAGIILLLGMPLCFLLKREGHKPPAPRP